MRKRQEINEPRSCLNKAAENEPIFVLRASDMLSPVLVDAWAELAALHGCAGAKVQEARLLANEMRDWPKRKFPD
jgi:hypothetical protein